MQPENIKSPKGTITIINDQHLVINDVRSFLDVLFSTEHNTVVLKKENFDPFFFDLTSGLAGDLLQRVSNYRKRLIIIGDFNNITSKSLGDFIYESNRHEQVIFTDEINKAIALLR